MLLGTIKGINLIQIKQNILATYRGWRNLEASLSSDFGARYVVIDDLSDSLVEPHQFHDLGEARESFERLSAVIQSTDTGRFHEYRRHKVDQSIQYLSQQPIAKVTGDDVVSRGGKWQPADEVELKQLMDMRVGLQNGISEDPAADEYQNKRVLPIDIGPLMSRQCELWISEVLGLGLGLKPFNYRVVTSNENIAARASVNRRAHDDHFELRVNTADHHHYTRALIDFIALHEACGHMAHLEVLRTVPGIQEREPDLLAIAIHTGQDSLLAEGIAQYLSWYLVEHSPGADDLVKLALVNFTLDLGIRHKCIYDYISGHLTLAEIVEYHVSVLGGDKKRVEEMYKLIVNSPFRIVAVLNYFSSFTALRPAHHLAPDIATDFLKEALTGFYTIDELRTMSQKYLEQ